MSDKFKLTVTTRTLVIALLSSALTACGGGSSSLNDVGVSASAAHENEPASTTDTNQVVDFLRLGGRPIRPSASTASTMIATTADGSHGGSSSSTTTQTHNTSTAATTITYKGVNLSGAEYHNNNPQARLGWDYIYPGTAEIDYYAHKGFTAIRLPFAGSRLQPQNNSPLNTTELGYIQTVVSYCASKHITVILDPHDYGLKYDSISGTMLPLGMAGGLPASNYADFWSRVAQAFKGQSNVIFGLMNEPNQQNPTQWATVANAAINAIRNTGATQLILIPGTDYTGAYDWVSSGNAAAWPHVSDTTNNFAFEVHQYLDNDNSGTHAECVAGKGATALAAATAWARSNGYHLFLGEVGWSQDPSCANEGPAIMNYTTANPDVWIGWTYWAAGPWIPQSYIFMLDPASLTAPVDKPQMQVLVQNL